MNRNTWLTLGRIQWLNLAGIHNKKFPWRVEFRKKRNLYFRHRRWLWKPESWANGQVARHLKRGLKKFPGRAGFRKKKKFAYPAPAVPDINSKKSRRGQSSIGASCYRFEQIFRFEINFMGFQKFLIFNPEGWFFMVCLPVLNVSNPFGHPGWRLYLPFSAKIKWILS